MAKRSPVPLTHLPYNAEPDYKKPLFDLPEETREKMLDRLRFLYGDRQADAAWPEFERILRVHQAHKTPELLQAEMTLDPSERFTQEDAVLITYGDQLQGDGTTPLDSLHRFVAAYNRGGINTLHLLPFFPYSSDRGFAVVDFTRVDPRLGTWEDIQRMGVDYALMFDGVLNHCSSRSHLFREFLDGDPAYRDFFIAYDSPDDLTPDQRSKIFRPRTSDILTRFDTYYGPQYVWTTFSEDQIDFNFRNPAVLLHIIEGLLFYIRQGADILRLDAVTYIWADPGTECVHLPQTHAIVKLLRDVLDAVAPGVALLTETNVPHRDNISYFGNGFDEAHLVYNFALPPLVLHAFYREDASVLSDWARELKNPSPRATFFNILDTHDGIGLQGAKEYLPPEEIEWVIRKAVQHGAAVSYKMTEHRTEEPYEINATWWSAVNGDEGEEDLELRVKRYLASRSIALVIQGVPALYVHGIIGSSNNRTLFRETGVKRDLNRAPINLEHLRQEAKNPGSRISQLGRIWPRLLLNRKRQPAFHPQGAQQVLNLSSRVFTVLRTAPEGDQPILALTHVAETTSTLDIPLKEFGLEASRWVDLLHDREHRTVSGKLTLTLEPYDVVWLKPVTTDTRFPLRR